MNHFGKQQSCPSSAEILSCIKGSITPLARVRVEQHVKLCDFCGAEMQLLTKHGISRPRRRRPRGLVLVSFLLEKRPTVKAAAVHRAYAA